MRGLITAEVARSALLHISPNCSRDEWSRVGFALASEFGYGGFDLFDTWSRGGETYVAAAAKSTWKSICRSKGSGKRVTIATVIAMAQANGFVMETPNEVSEIARREQERRRAEVAARREREEREREAEALRAAMLSAQRWSVASRDGRSPYLERKLIADPESIRFEPDATILVPMVRYDQPREKALVGVQAIRPDGSKRFGVGTAKRESACRLGHVVVDDPILIAEGWATGMSVRMAVGRRWPVFVAFDAGNIEPVVAIVRALHPTCPIVVCADDDWRTPGNPGRLKAKQAARTWSNVHTVFPVWPGPRSDADTDFNDLHRAAGLPVVERQLRNALALLAQASRRPRIARAA